MSNKSLMITGAVLLLIGVAVWTLVGFGKDESIEERRSNLNPELEEAYQNNERYRAIQEEMAEDAARQSAPAQ